MVFLMGKADGTLSMGMIAKLCILTVPMPVTIQYSKFSLALPWSVSPNL